MIPNAPLYRDPIYDAPTDPVVIWNHKEQCWWMLYTQRRNAKFSIGASHVHGTDIGVASSKDGNRWLYRGTLPGLAVEPGHNTYWAPEIIWAEGKYHMYVSYITGVPTDWYWPRHIAHYTAEDPWDWKFEGFLKLSSERIIDVCIYEIEPGLYKMWYKDEDHESHTYAAVSTDLHNWTVVGDEISYNGHEGPNVFELGGKKWMITDEWDGLGVYESEDFAHWNRQGVILKEAGTRECDNVKAHHADVLVYEGNAYIFYFTHPYVGQGVEMQGRACVQVAQLEVIDGKLICDRNKEFNLKMERPV